MPYIEMVFERRETGRRRPTFSWERVKGLACFENLADSVAAVYSQGKETDCFTFLVLRNSGNVTWKFESC